MFNLKSIVLGAAVVFATSITLSSCGDKEKAAKEKAMADSVRVADSMAMVEAAAKATADSIAAAAPKSISEVAGANADLSSLVGALTTAELVETFKGAGAFTVFAPNNAAFEAVKAAVEKVSKDKAKLTSVLKFHVVEGSLKAADLTDGKELVTLQGEKLKVTVKDGKVMVGGAEVVAADVATSNGTVHVINKVLMPKKM